MLTFAGGLGMLAAAALIDVMRIIDVLLSAGGGLLVFATLGNGISQIQLNCPLINVHVRAKRRETEIADHCAKVGPDLRIRAIQLTDDEAIVPKLVERAAIRAGEEWTAPVGGRLTLFLLCVIIEEAAFLRMARRPVVVPLAVGVSGRGPVGDGTAVDGTAVDGIAGVWATFSLYERAVVLLVERMRVPPHEVARILERTVGTVERDHRRCVALLTGERLAA